MLGLAVFVAGAATVVVCVSDAVLGDSTCATFRAVAGVLGAEVVVTLRELTSEALELT